MKSKANLMPTALIILTIVGFIYLLPIDKLLQDDPKNAPTATPTKPLTEEYPRDIVVIGKVTKNNVGNLEMNLATKNGDFIINYGNFSNICKNKTTSKGKSISKNESVEIYGSFDGNTINTCLDSRYYISKEFCGDSICQAFACNATGCPNPETKANCPADCFGDPEKKSSIEELKKNIATGQTYIIKGYVVFKYFCPVCPEGSYCKTCQEPNILIMNNNEKVVSIKINQNNMIVYTDKIDEIDIGTEYIFTVKASSTYSTGDIIPDIKLLNFKPVQLD